MHLSTSLNKVKTAEINVTPQPSFDYNYAYDFSYEKREEERLARLELIDTYYWLLYDGVIKKEKCEKYMRYTQPLTKRHVVRYEKAKELIIPYNSSFGRVKLAEGDDKTVFKIPYVRTQKPVIVGVADYFTSQAYEMTWNRQELEDAGFEHILEISLQHSFTEEIKIRQVNRELDDSKYRGQSADQEGIMRDIYDIVEIETEPKTFEDNYDVYYDCKPHRLICPSIRLEKAFTDVERSFRYFLRLRHSEKCVSIKRSGLRPILKLRHFAVFLDARFDFDHCDIFTKELYDFKVKDICTDELLLRRDFFFRTGNSITFRFSGQDKLVIAQRFCTSDYTAFLRITCYFDTTNTCDSAYLPLFMPIYQPQKHRAKVICMRWM